MTMTATTVAWIEARGLDPELASRLGWSTSRTSDDREWLKIPYVRDEKVINNKYRRLEGKAFKNDAGSEHDLWNVDCLKDRSLDNEPLVITEGECDALAVMQVGFQRVVSIPDGWTQKLENEDGGAKFEIFKRNEDLIRRAEVIIAAVDNDDTGHSLLRAIANFFDGKDVRFLQWPEGAKDANDVLLLHGHDVLVKALTSARRIDPPGGIITGFSDLPPRPKRVVWKLKDFPALETLIAFRSREFSVLTGTPASGKTTFITWLCHKFVVAHDLRVAIGAFETDPEELFEHLVKLNTGWDVETLDEDQLKEQREILDRNYRIYQPVEDGDSGHGIAWFSKMVHTLAARDGCNIIIGDPWNELEHLPEPGEAMTNYINFALKQIRVLADKYDIHICIVAHPKKMHDARKPLGYDIADSAAFANKPGLGLTIHLESNEKLGEHVSLTNWKVRNRKHTGCKPGMKRLQYDQYSMVYRPAF